MTTASSIPTHVETSNAFIPAVVTAAGALVINLVLWLIGSAAGASFEITTPGAASAQTVGPVMVAALSVIAPVIGGIALLATKARRQRFWPILAWLGLAIGVITMPAFAEADGATKLVLSLMHLATGGFWFYSVRRSV